LGSKAGANAIGWKGRNPLRWHALQGAENCQAYREDARSEQARSYFENAAYVQRRLAEHGKEVLRQCLESSGALPEEAGSAAGDETVVFEPDEEIRNEIDGEA